jgi:hypothetical protein
LQKVLDRFSSRLSKVCWFFYVIYYLFGAHSSVVGWGTVLQARRSRDWVLMRWIFSIYLILPGPGVDSASNRNEYQESWG